MRERRLRQRLGDKARVRRLLLSVWRLVRISEPVRPPGPPLSGIFPEVLPGHFPQNGEHTRVLRANPGIRHLDKLNVTREPLLQALAGLEAPHHLKTHAHIARHVPPNARGQQSVGRRSHRRARSPERIERNGRCKDACAPEYRSAGLILIDPLHIEPLTLDKRARHPSLARRSSGPDMQTVSGAHRPGARRCRGDHSARPYQSLPVEPPAAD